MFVFWSAEKARGQPEVGVCGGGHVRRGSGSGEDRPAGHLHRDGCLLPSWRHGFRQQHGHSGRWWRTLRMTRDRCAWMLLVKLHRSHVLNASCAAESSDEDHLTMEDLISYSFQVSKGMEFLSSRKVKLWLLLLLLFNLTLHFICDCELSWLLCSVSTEIWQPETSCSQRTMWSRSATLASPEMSTKTPTMSAREMWVPTNWQKKRSISHLIDLWSS